MVVLATLFGVMLIAVARFGGDLVDAARARTAADAAALAGATTDRDAAAAMASADGGSLVAYIDDGRTVLVTVVVGSRRASARAAKPGAPLTTLTAWR